VVARESGSFSVGGYVIVGYMLKYPGHLNKLILASRVGIPENPYAVEVDLSEPRDFDHGQRVFAELLLGCC
jgi:pimeloyl-ACP methyl ester carboxylesterase